MIKEGQEEAERILAAYAANGLSEEARDDLRPDFPPTFGRIRRLVSGLMRPSFPVSI